MSKDVVLSSHEVARLIRYLQQAMDDNYTGDHRKCALCRATDDFRGRLYHREDCPGSSLLDMLTVAVDGSDMSASKIKELLGQETIHPSEGHAAMQWVIGVGRKGMELPSIIRILRKIRAKMGFPAV